MSKETPSARGSLELHSHVVGNPVLDVAGSGAERPGPALVLVRAMWVSLLVSALAVALGLGFGWVTNALWGPAADTWIRNAQIAGTGILLWGTLFVRGAEIQTWDAGSPTERANQWIFRSLYCIGTTFLVWSLASGA